MTDEERIDFLERLLRRGGGSVMLTAWFSTAAYEAERRECPDGYAVGYRSWGDGPRDAAPKDMEEHPCLREAIDRFRGGHEKW